jgi:hypothetical protein
MTSTTRMLSSDLSIRRALNTWPPSPRRLLSTATNDFNIDIFLHSPDSPLQKLLPLISRFGFNPRYLQSLPWVSVDQCSLTHDLLTAFLFLIKTYSYSFSASTAFTHKDIPLHLYDISFCITELHLTFHLWYTVQHIVRNISQPQFTLIQRRKSHYSLAEAQLRDHLEFRPFLRTNLAWKHR